MQRSDLIGAGRAALALAPISGGFMPGHPACSMRGSCGPNPHSIQSTT